MTPLAPEVLVAALLPPLAFWLIARRSSHLREVAVAFPVAVLLWTAPYWIAGRTAAPVDFLSETAPWSSLRPNGYLNKNFLLNDTVLQFLPWTASGRASWRSGEMPFLDRASAAGSALWANPQAAVLSPLSLAAVVLPLVAWPVFVIACKLLVALCGTYLFLRGENLSVGAARFGAAAFAFSVFSLGFILFPHTSVTMLLPLVLWQIGRVVSGSWKDVAILALLVALMFAGGHPESVFHSALAGVAYALRTTWSSATARGRTITRLTAAAALALAIAAPLVIPFLAQLPHSQRIAELKSRGAGYFATEPMNAGSLVPFILPNYFGNPRVHNYRHAVNFNDLASQYAGLLTLALALYAAVRGIDHFWSGTLVVATLIAIPPPFLASLLARIPLFDISANGRLRFVIVLAMAVLAAKALDHPMEAGGRTFRLIGAAVLVTTVAICVASYPLFAQYGIRRLIFFTTLPALAALALAVLVTPKLSKFAGATWVLISIDLFAVAGLYNPAVERKFFYPDTPAIRLMKSAPGGSRVTGLGRAMMASSAAVIGLEDIRTHDPMAFRPYVELLERNGYDQSTYFGQFRSLPPQRLLDFLGVRYVLAESAIDARSLRLVHRGDDGYLYENRSALPRFFIPRGGIEGLLDRGVTVDGKAEVRFIEYGRNGSVIEVRSPAGTMMASSEVALPGWRLDRNGSPWPLTTVGRAFLAWRVPPGVSRFRLRYRPPAFVPSLIAALAGLTAALAILAGSRRGQTAEPQGAAVTSANMRGHHGVVS